MSTRRIAKVAFLNLFLIFILIELTSFILIELFNYSRKPSFRIASFQNTDPKNADIDSVFGVWHLPNTKFRHITDCFDVLYEFNSIGARDIERTYDSDTSRIMFIGDSFVEGFGLESSSRVSNLIESKTGLEVLNFGTSGSFGSTQINLLYQSMASKFEHTLLVVMLFPFNDFDEDDIHIGKERFNDRYRPYLLIKDDSSRIIYHLDKLEDSSWHPSNLNSIHSSTEGKYPDTAIGFLKSVLRRYSYSYQILARFDKGVNIEKKSNYFLNNIEGWQILKQNLKEIKSTAIQNKAELLVITIPSHSEFSKLTEDSNYKLVEELKDLSRTLNFHYLDIFSDLKGVVAASDLYFPCDGHWSVSGSELIANYLQPSIDSLSKIGESRQ